MGSAIAVGVALNGGRVWWVAPTYPVSLFGWREVKSLSRQIPGTEISESARCVTYRTGGSVQVRSADNPDSLRGEGLDLVVIDEAAFVFEEAWAEALRPALADREGRALIISTPNGRNWFWRAYLDGQDPMKPEWASWQVPTSTNPFIKAKEIEAQRAGSTDRVFRQEFLAEFMEDGGGVFRGVRAMATSTPQARAIDGHRYVVGIDWGQSYDFTVIVVVDATTKEVVYVDRSNKVEYALQVSRVLDVCSRFKPDSVIPERNSMGIPLVEDLARKVQNVKPFTTTLQSKGEAIEALSLAIEKGELRLLYDPVMLAELEAYECASLQSGLRRYGAPDGMHDDVVMALAFAWSGAKTQSAPFHFVKIGTPSPFATPEWQRGRGWGDPPGGYGNDDDSNGDHRFKPWLS